jgi:DNA-damage-inducible protein J
MVTRWEAVFMNTNINIRTTSELKTNANDVLKRMGLDMSTAVNIFLTQIVYKNANPFEISTKFAS